jgi:hypothetical protein
MNLSKEYCRFSKPPTILVLSGFGAVAVSADRTRNPALPLLQELKTRALKILFSYFLPLWRETLL